MVVAFDNLTTTTTTDVFTLESGKKSYRKVSSAKAVISELPFEMLTFSRSPFYSFSSLLFTEY